MGIQRIPFAIPEPFKTTFTLAACAAFRICAEDIPLKSGTFVTSRELLFDEYK